AVGPIAMGDVIWLDHWHWIGAGLAGDYSSRPGRSGVFGTRRTARTDRVGRHIGRLCRFDSPGPPRGVARSLGLRPAAGRRHHGASRIPGFSDNRGSHGTSSAYRHNPTIRLVRELI